MGLFGNKTESETGAVSVLREDHEKVKELFDRFEEADDKRTKQHIVEETLNSLKIHTKIEEEIFYPAFREANSDDEEIDDTMDEALQEHHVAKILIAELEDMSPGDEFYDAKYTVLAENVKHHIEEEESDIFPKVDDDDPTWTDVGERMKARREKLQEGGSRTSKGKTPASRTNGRAATKGSSTRKPAAARRK